jgi:hypothetical protein
VIQEGKNIHKINGKKVKCMILHRNCLLKQVIEGNIEGKRSDGKTRKKA